MPTAKVLQIDCTLTAEGLQLRRLNKKIFFADGHQRTLTDNLALLRSLIASIVETLSRGTPIDDLQS